MTLGMILHSYNNQKCLSMQLKSLSESCDGLKEFFELIFIDDGSYPSLIIEDTTTLSRLNIIHLRIKKDIPWNMAGCKNLGAFYSKSEWVLFTDICHIIEPGGVRALLNLLPRLEENSIYLFNRTFSNNGVTTSKVHPNTFLVNRRRFLDNQGVDEAFVGHYGYEDIYFVHKWKVRGGDVALIPLNFHDHGLKTVNLDRDLSRNKKLMESLVQKNCPMTDFGLIKFEYERLL